MRYVNAIFAVAMIVLLPFSEVYAYATGISGFSRAGCNGCHTGGVAPTVVLSGPTSVAPGSTNIYTLTMSGGQQLTGGLDVSASSGTLFNSQARTIVLGGEITHYMPFNADATGQIVWTFSWTAPSFDADVNIYAAALSADDSLSSSGDAGATTSLAITVGAGGGGGGGTVDGAALYTSNCSGCHGPLATSAKAGRTAAQIQGAINANTGGMGGLSFLTTAEIDAIAAALSGQPQAPVAVPGGPYTGDVNVAVTFDGSASTDADGTIVSYAWDFGDGTTGTGATVSHTYTAAGNYTVTLTVTDDTNLTGTASTSANIGVAAIDGAALYTTNCSACHGPLATSAKAGRTAAQIQAAINANTGGMGSLSFLTAAEIQAIADALSAQPQAPVANPGGPYTGDVNLAVAFDGSGSTDADGTIVSYSWDFGDGATGTGATVSHTYTATGNYTVTLTVTDDSNMTGTASTSANIGVAAIDGAALYTTNCSGCHGALATSAKLGRTAAQIQAAINANTGGMGSLSALTTPEIQAIATALSGTSTLPVANPGGFYSGLTGATIVFDGSGSTDNGTIVSYAWDFGDGTTGTGVSPSHAYAAAGTYTVSLTVTDNDGNTNTATTTATITDTLPPVLDGLALYNTNCAGCHGAAPGSKAGRTATQIRNAINVVQAMSGLSGLTDAELQAIADAIGNGGGGTDGKSLYDSYCSACHGPEGKGGTEEAVLNESASSIQSAISEEQAMQYLADLLTADEIAMIADYLNPGKTLYDQYCMACHGREGKGGTEEGVRGESASSISSAINEESAMNYLGSLLTAEDISQIANYLNGNGGSEDQKSNGEEEHDD